ncbi:ankyrin-1-like isoform X1 [Diabrotica virgifera virgifera]|uniref:PRANC domain-containing protein n=2 Tax=Diabrotica virgifera virgifera TaxID=50390 RepID=A0ABM5K4S7_DIAVI|nr:ankyrin-1-like isoform X1 [Diabrotica virgifera virgifera]
MEISGFFAVLSPSFCSGLWLNLLFKQFLISKTKLFRQVNAVLHVFLNMSQIEFPLHLASRLGNLDAVQQLIEGGAEINEVDSSGLTALHVATFSQHKKVAKYLLAHGADLNAIETYQQETPLNISTGINDHEMVRLLIEAGANMQCLDISGNMPIHIAAKKGYLNIVECFLENGINVDILNEISKMTPLHMAACGGYIEVVDYLLLNNANVHLKDCRSRSSIHHGVLGGKAKIVKMLIEKGVDVNVEDINWTPLHLACRHGNLEIVKLLLENGAVYDNRQGKSRNYSPLLVAIEMGHLEIIKYFISIGVDVNFSTNNEDYTLLHAACTNTQAQVQIEIVKLLIENGADVNKKTLSKGATPLYCAINRMRPYVAELLILNGADLKQSKYKGNSLLSIALNNVERNYEEINRFCGNWSEQTDSMEIARVIIKYTVLIYNPIKTIIQDGCPFFRAFLQYYNDCQKEITSMKSMIIKNTNVSLYRIICDSNKGNNAFVQYLRNDNIKNELQNIEDYLKEFSIYGNILPLVQHWVKKGFQRMELLAHADVMMKKLAPQLPSEIRWKVLDYLNMSDLKIMIQSDFFKYK